MAAPDSEAGVGLSSSRSSEISNDDDGQLRSSPPLTVHSGDTEPGGPSALTAEDRAPLLLALRKASFVPVLSALLTDRPLSTTLVHTLEFCHEQRATLPPWTECQALLSLVTWHQLRDTSRSTSLPIVAAELVHFIDLYQQELFGPRLSDLVLHLWRPMEMSSQGSNLSASRRSSQVGPVPSPRGLAVARKAALLRKMGRHWKKHRRQAMLSVSHSSANSPRSSAAPSTPVASPLLARPAAASPMPEATRVVANTSYGTCRLVVHGIERRARQEHAHCGILRYFDKDTKQDDEGELALLQPYRQWMRAHHHVWCPNNKAGLVHNYRSALRDLTDLASVDGVIGILSLQSWHVMVYRTGLMAFIELQANGQLRELHLDQQLAVRLAANHDVMVSAVIQGTRLVYTTANSASLGMAELAISRGSDAPPRIRSLVQFELGEGLRAMHAVIWDAMILLWKGRPVDTILLLVHIHPSGQDLRRLGELTLPNTCVDLQVYHDEVLAVLTDFQAPGLKTSLARCRYVLPDHDGRVLVKGKAVTFLEHSTGSNKGIYLVAHYPGLELDAPPAAVLPRHQGVDLLTRDGTVYRLLDPKSGGSTLVHVDPRLAQAHATIVHPRLPLHVVLASGGRLLVTDGNWNILPLRLYGGGPDGELLDTLFPFELGCLLDGEAVVGKWLLSETRTVSDEHWLYLGCQHNVPVLLCIALESSAWSTTSALSPTLQTIRAHMEAQQVELALRSLNHGRIHRELPPKEALCAYTWLLEALLDSLIGNEATVGGISQAMDLIASGSDVLSATGWQTDSSDDDGVLFEAQAWRMLHWLVAKNAWSDILRLVSIVGRQSFLHAALGLARGCSARTDSNTNEPMAVMMDTNVAILQAMLTLVSQHDAEESSLA
ncbi:uncharacterized protein MONBRDRAFT_30732 [Monosiga brevicollis MX1]|uniref:Uncharacterized protein n=1 Tax=Monosiga brevicollis TaxID=81824 RepID=A9UNV2_MONBE|nr:uncharacterized protein MONBRDRAFT_30732 [Monosiga brevicollis MX1]EDQ92765.1 predicted protein [Monosiga brevicollis MX1]|eukprot:XP_001742527.1 hypothetical protein [Monosiga brevicollis MX1]